MAGPPSVTTSLKELQEVVLPLLIPRASTFTAPLLNGFASAHDPLLENDTLFAAKSDLGAVQVELDAAARTLARTSSAKEAGEKDTAGLGLKDASSDVAHLLETIRHTRLRRKLYSLSTTSTFSNTEPSSQQSTQPTQSSISRASRQRREAFDFQIQEEEKKALDNFKRQLREAVLKT